MPDFEFDSEVGVTSKNMNTWVRDQVRAIVTSASLPYTTTDKRQIIERDTGREREYDAITEEWVLTSTGPASPLAWAPSIWQNSGTAAPIAHTDVECEINRVGGMWFLSALVLFTAGGTAGQPVTIALPSDALPATGVSTTIGSFSFTRAGVPTVGTIAKTSSTTAIFVATSTGTGYFGVNPAVTITAGDYIAMDLHYRALA